MEFKILSYGCTSAAGPHFKDFWNGLCEGVDHPKVETNRTLVSQMLLAWNQVLEGLTPAKLKLLKEDKNLGVIFASTKGSIEEFIWTEVFSEEKSDPLTPVLEEFLKAAEISTDNYLCVSNACSSTVAALFLAQRWLKQKRVDHVLVVAGDQIGPFVTKGFSSLKALSATQKLKPFSEDRDGLQLGEGAAAILLGPEGDFTISGIAIDTEGYAVTRPSGSGVSLKKVLRLSLGSSVPDLIIAHGTGTPANDEIEDHVFSDLFGESVPVTSTKWSIGHTLGASAAMDLIAACESIKNQRAFYIANTEKKDPHFKARYLVGKNKPEKMHINKVLVSSLGFGGVHGAILVDGGPH